MWGEGGGGGGGGGEGGEGVFKTVLLCQGFMKKNVWSVRNCTA